MLSGKGKTAITSTTYTYRDNVTKTMGNTFFSSAPILLSLRRRDELA